MNIDLASDSLLPLRYTSLEMFVLFNQLGLFEHLSTKELSKVERKVQRIPDNTPLLPVFILLTAPNTAIFFGTGLAHQDERQYKLPKYPQTEWPISISQLQRIARGRIRFDPSEDRSFPSPGPDPLDYANELLCNMDQDERFYWILFRDDLVSNGGPYMRRMILFLSSQQLIALDRRMIFKFKDYQAYIWSPARLEDIFKILKDLRLLKHLDSSEIQDAKAKIMLEDHHHVVSILDAFPELLYWVDAEMIYEPVEDYAELINGLRNISRGMFVPENILITDADIYQPHFTISFNLGGTEHSIPMEYTGDYINWDFLKSINKILQQREKSVGFYILPTDDQTAPIIFLDDKQIQQARKWNIFGLGTTVVAEIGLGQS